MTQKLDGKVAVVTGASSGIGEAMSGDKPLLVYALTFISSRESQFVDELVR